MSNQSIKKVLQRYLEDVIASEKSFESQLRTMATESDYAPAKMVFATHASETKSQLERLTARLEQLGGSVSSVKTAMAHMFNFTPKAPPIGHDTSEKASRNIIMGFTIANSEVATYEALATVAAAAGDMVTEKLAREIQEEERRASNTLWHLIAPSCEIAFREVASAA
jgi:ferritin-like metal-binding protein YciE